MIADLRTPPQFNRFTTQPTIGGYEVIDADGRTVYEKPTLREATGTAFRLNKAAAASPQALAAALGGGR